MPRISLDYIYNSVVEPQTSMIYQHNVINFRRFSQYKAFSSSSRLRFVTYTPNGPKHHQTYLFPGGRFGMISSHELPVVERIRATRHPPLGVFQTTPLRRRPRRRRIAEMDWSSPYKRRPVSSVSAGVRRERPNCHRSRVEQQPETTQ
ncbi:unnamed protein product [Musa acuminata subsp. burmannicoides]